MSIQIIIEGDTAAQLLAEFMGLAGPMSVGMQVIKAQQVQQQQSGQPVASADTPSAPAESAEKKPRGRPKKEPEVVAPAPATLVPDDVTDIDTNGDPVAASATADDVKKLLLDMTSKMSMAAGYELLQKYKSKNVTELMATGKADEFVAEAKRNMDALA